MAYPQYILLPLLKSQHHFEAFALEVDALHRPMVIWTLGPRCPCWWQAASGVHALMRAVHACGHACRACCAYSAYSACRVCVRIVRAWGKRAGHFEACAGAAAWAAVMGWWQ